MTHRLQFLGGGKMAEALLAGLLSSGWAAIDELAVVERMPARRQELAAAFDGLALPDEPLEGVDVLLAVKPQDIDAALGALAGRGVRRLLSIAAGVTTAGLEARLDPGVRVVRAMPNTPALVGEGAAALAAGSAAGDADLEWGIGVLSSVGTAIAVEEAQLDAVTGLSGSGPAYVFLVAEAMIAAGVDVGLSDATARSLTEQTLFGAATLLRDSPRDPAQLRADVTSPGGTTAEGIAALVDRGLSEAFVAAVRAATERSAELGRG